VQLSAGPSLQSIVTAALDFASPRISVDRSEINIRYALVPSCALMRQISGMQSSKVVLSRLRPRRIMCRGGLETSNLVCMQYSAVIQRFARALASIQPGTTIGSRKSTSGASGSGQVPRSELGQGRRSEPLKTARQRKMTILNFWETLSPAQYLHRKTSSVQEAYKIKKAAPGMGPNELPSGKDLCANSVPFSYPAFSQIEEHLWRSRVLFLCDSYSYRAPLR
jgi:hypothetical protein